MTRPLIPFSTFVWALFINGCDVNQDRDATGRDESRPSRSEVETLESKVDHLPCIDDVKKWRREYYYSFSKQSNKSNTDILQFSFEKSAGDQVKPDRVFLSPGGLPNLDDRDIMIAWGHLDKKTGIIKISYCGRNRP